PVRAPVRRRSSATIANDDGPAGLSTRTMPAGLRARGGKLPSHELRDLFDRCLAREACRLAMPTSARLACDRGHVELVDARPEADAPRRTVLPRRLANEHGHVGSLDGAEIVDDPLRVRLGGADLREVGAQEIRDDDATSLVDLGTVEGSRE